MASSLLYSPHPMAFLIEFGGGGGRKKYTTTTIIYNKNHYVISKILYSRFYLPLKLVTLVNDMGPRNKSYTVSDVILSTKTSTFFE